jgi:hypothetical protein
MIFRLELLEEESVESIFKDSMKELNEFFGINWVHHIPRLVVVPDRKTVEFW